MGRAKRGKLLIPALVAVATAIACGGTSIGEDGGDGSDPGSGDASNGASYGRGGGPTISSGGTNSIPPDGTPYAGGPSAGGAAGVLYGCPPSAPPDGSRCAMPPNGLGACGYIDNCGQQVTAICHQGANWQVLASGMECNGGAPNDPTGALVCPSRLPAMGSKCDIPASIVSYQCMYPNGCTQLIETCDQHRVWFTSASFTDCAGAGGAG
jgi:hypothetical protein